MTMMDRPVATMARLEPRRRAMRRYLSPRNVTPATTAAPSGATTTYTYDPAGNKLTSTDPDGVTTTWTYTPADQPATETYSGSSAHSVSYGYDANGNKTSMTDATGSSSYTFDPFGEMTAATNGAGQTVGYGYDADGDTTSITYPLPSGATWATSDTVTYGYNNADVLKSATDFNGNEISITDSADSLPDSEVLGSTGDTISTAYDPTDTPSAIALKNSSTTLQSFTYSDAPDGSILNETDIPSSSHSPAAYTYDGQGRLVSMTSGSGSPVSYTFDASGSLTTLPTGATTTYDKASELTSSTLSGTATDYSYNADGEPLSGTQASTTISAATWNGAGQLTAYSNSAAGMTSATYDGDGLRASSSATPTGGSAASQQYVWNTSPDVSQLLMDSASAYIYTSGTAPAEQVNLATGTITYLVADSLGSVRGTVSSSGTLTGTTSYDAWGNAQTSGGLTATTPFGFAGGYTDPDGLIYLINRYYNPQTGQFISVDPDLSQTLLPYAYTDGDPVTDTDPTGLENVLADHATCRKVADGSWKAKLCVEVNISTLVFSDESEPQAVWVVTSGAIANAGARLLDMEVCDSHGPKPGHPIGCHQNDDPTKNPRSTCGGKVCYLNGGWYTNLTVNWEDAWVRGAWLTWKGGPRLKAAVSLHEHPLCRNGNGKKYQCDPNW
jgi:RHS repeat-associated protein